MLDSTKGWALTGTQNKLSLPVTDPGHDANDSASGATWPDVSCDVRCISGEKDWVTQRGMEVMLGPEVIHLGAYLLHLPSSDVKRVSSTAVACFIKNILKLNWRCFFYDCGRALKKLFNT